MPAKNEAKNINFWKKLLQDMLVVMGNDPYMATVCLEEWADKMCDNDEIDETKKMIKSIEDRLLSIRAQDWD